MLQLYNVAVFIVVMILLLQFISLSLIFKTVLWTLL